MELLTVGFAFAFLFVTGCGDRGLPDAYRARPTLQKPFQLDELRKTLAQLLPVS